MEINLNTLEDTINDISFIVESEEHEFDLEESIAQCLSEINIKISEKNNNNKPNKNISKKNLIRTNSYNYNNLVNNKLINKRSSLHSKEEINNIKNQIINIFKDNTEKMKKIHKEQIENDNNIEKTLFEARKIYEEELEKLYNEKLNKINELNNKYNNDIFELKDFVNEEMKGREDGKSNLKQILDSVIIDKEIESKKIEEEFLKKEKKIKKNYKKINNDNDEFTEDDRSVIFKNQFFDNLKTKIQRVINGKNK